MKAFFLVIMLFSSSVVFSQQHRPLFRSSFKTDTITISTAGDPAKGILPKDSISIVKTVAEQFAIYGIGNVSDEALKNLNAGGKIAVSFTAPKKGWAAPLNYFASFNKNASNTDSLLSTVLVFPEVGSHSFSFTSFWMEPGSQNGFFLEFVTKKIKNEVDTTNFKSVEYVFNTLHYTAGYSRGFNKVSVINNKEYSLGCYISGFLSYVNIPDEDHESFEKIARLSARNNSFLAAGAKVAFEINGFQFFADIRNVFGSKEKLPLKDLKGFNSNIGVSFNTEVVKF
jgi:hypothetical protein